ncbi:hypothetical protein A4A49_39989 [Nicotiana attenuata]|uniref:Uncharacterized protein n=1 Tax=Nicotiana attenuata TaxID=49451 RepID=A0A1J6K8T9_NICAT|nr:hypothetical protein A4A49_39989 [Nicotiana attenuata]
MQAKIDNKEKKVAKAKEELNTDDKMMLEKNIEAKLILYNVLSLGEIYRISTCNTANEIQKRLLAMHEETHSDMALMVWIKTDS